MRGAGRLIAALAFAATAVAAAAPDEEPLEPEQAFPVSGRVQAKGAARLEVTFRIRDGYYLYRDRFKVTSEGVALGKPILPAGTAKNDPFVGPSRIYRKAVTLRVPLAASLPSGHYVVRVTAQGCAEERLCYAPFTQDVAIRVP